ncbi:exportin 1 [Dorcoceras hygrometricum]|uniref:Exportin 1 n=1 Tax=Dorcoceras hygrometricum TaxID=472368 RepID=A0A2Z7BKR4_9LAMI|nr:exportin 1 [Dorcoceras hygrometricum]
MFKRITLLALVPGSNRYYKNPALLGRLRKSHFPKSSSRAQHIELSIRAGISSPITCVTLNGSGIQLAVGPQPLWLRSHNSGLAQRIMVKRLATSPHDPLGITDSACKNQSVVVSVQYGPFNPYIPIRSTTIGKSRVAIDPIAMHTSWRSNSDIASVTRTDFLLMNCHGMHESRADAKLLFSLCFAILTTVDESVHSRYSRRLLMSNVEQEADTSKPKMTSAYLLEEAGGSNHDIIISVEEAGGSNRDVIISIIEADEE